MDGRETFCRAAVANWERLARRLAEAANLARLDVERLDVRDGVPVDDTDLEEVSVLALARVSVRAVVVLDAAKALCSVADDGVGEPGGATAILGSPIVSV